MPDFMTLYIADTINGEIVITSVRAIDNRDTYINGTGILGELSGPMGISKELADHYGFSETEAGAVKALARKAKDRLTAASDRMGVVTAAAAAWRKAQTETT